MIDKFFKIAADIANLKDDMRIFHVGAVGIRDDGTIVASANGPVMLGNLHDYKRRSFPAAHAETRCVKKMSKNSIIFVARTRRDDFSYAMARPCVNCLGILLAKSVLKIYYTIDSEKYGIINVKNKKVVSENIKSFS